MNIRMVVHEGHADRFEDYASKTTDHSDHGVVLTLPTVKSFNRSEMGHVLVTFEDGETVEVPYGDITSGHDAGV